MIRKGGTPVAWKLNLFKPPASGGGPFVSSSVFGWHDHAWLAVGEMARYSHAEPFHWTLKYSRLKPLVLSLPLHLLSVPPSQKFLSISLFSAFLACFFLWHSFLSLVSFLLHQESKADHTLSFLLSCILSMVNQKALFHEWPLFRERAHLTSPLPSCLCTAEWSWNAALPVSLSRHLPPPLYPSKHRNAVSSPWAASISPHGKVFIWAGRKHVAHIERTCVFSAESLTSPGPTHSGALHSLDMGELWDFPFWILNVELLSIPYTWKCCKKMEPGRMVMSQVSGESLWWASKWGSFASLRKEFESEPR